MAYINGREIIDFVRFGTDYKLGGSWVFNETLTLPTAPIEQDINFNIKGNALLWVKITAGFEGKYLAYTDEEGGIGVPYNFNHADWPDFNKRYITFDGTQTVSKEFYYWFTANAVQTTEA